MDALAIYPLKPIPSRRRAAGLLGTASVLMIVLVHVLLGGEPSLRWFQVALSLLFAAFPVVYWFLSRGPRAGGGDVELLADCVRVPTDHGAIKLDLGGMEMKQATSRVGLAIGGIPVSSDLETGRTVELRSRSARVSLDSDQFIDEQHLRLLVEHIQIVAAGGKPDGAPAFLARGFE
jgi:hypothetical protein